MEQRYCIKFCQKLGHTQVETIRKIQQAFGDDLGLRRVPAKFVPKLLTVEQKQLRQEIAQDMLDCVESDSNFLNTVITGDESWVYGYDPATKAQSSQ